MLENESELNQMCLQALKKVGRMPDAESLHWLQLLKWGLETGELSVEKDKEYLAELALGAETDTQDADGKIILSGDPSGVASGSQTAATAEVACRRLVIVP